MDFALFEQRLRQHWGEEAARVRHEIYFIAQHGSGWRQIGRAVMGLIRDAWICACLPRYSELLTEVVCVVSLASASGWGALSPLIPLLHAAGRKSSVAIHPRLVGKIDSQVGDIALASPDVHGWMQALRALFRRGRSMLPGISPWTIRCCLARHHLWCGVWRRILTQAKSGSKVRLLLLHNDFDMFSGAAVQVVKAIAAKKNSVSTIRTVCVQHGLPTDEFFPTRADIQLLWGETSRKVFIEHGDKCEAIVVGTPRAAVLGVPISGVVNQCISRARGVKYTPSLASKAVFNQAPKRVLLISQTHTPIFGRPLNGDFLLLANRLHKALGKDQMAILLHPDEVRLGHPYVIEALRSLCRYPPHQELQVDFESDGDPELVVGFCSTALIEAAAAGHYVLGLDWMVPACQGAIRVGAPERKVRDVDAVVAEFQLLQSNELARAEWQSAQRMWLTRTFAPLPDNWIDIIAGLNVSSKHASSA
jgi:hypothetical protein